MHQLGCKIYVFLSLKTSKGSILHRIEIKNLEGHSRFQKLQLDKQKPHMYLKFYNYQDC